MARIKIGDWLIEDAALTMSGGRMCLRWAGDAWDGTLDSAAELLGAAIGAAETALGERIDGQAALLDATRVAARRTVAADADAMMADELAACAPLFDAWDGGSVAYSVDDIVAYDGALYRCAQAHTSQAGWTPDTTRALWTPMGVSADDPEAVPEWVQPTGAHDAYPKGAHVMHGGIEWVSDVDANVWEPGVSGWTQVGGDAG